MRTIPRNYPAANSSVLRWRGRLSGDPAILLADEPTGNLDERTGAHVIDLLLAQRARRGSTLVLVTHDLTLASRCDAIVRLKSRTDRCGAGRIAGCGGCVVMAGR